MMKTTLEEIKADIARYEKFQEQFRLKDTGSNNDIGTRGRLNGALEALRMIRDREERYLKEKKPATQPIIESGDTVFVEESDSFIDRGYYTVSEVKPDGSLMLYNDSDRWLVPIKSERVILIAKGIKI